MLDAAAELFRSQGYHATGLSQIVEVSRAPKGSLYFHFPGGKEQLAAEAMREAAGRVRELLVESAAASPDTVSALGSVIGALTTELAATEFRGGCPLATVALDAATESDQIAVACRDGYDSWRDAIGAMLIRNGATPQRAAELATVVLAAIEGALLLARINRDVAPLRAVHDHLITFIAKELG